MATAPLAESQIRAGWRLDPETGEALRPGVMTRAEFRAWRVENRRRWMAWAFGPKPEGDWVMVPLLGWTRASGASKARPNGATKS